ncbi:MAG: protein kinase [Deltaproteobacteria bacterium]|nr:protein kinase [Deltaproteobacteria bacterium]
MRASELGGGAVIDGKYRVDRVLGEGGMGRVVAATHLRLGTQVAIKVLLPELAASTEIAHRFMREARAASALHSDHVCRVIDVGELDGGAPYMVMEMLDGADLAQVVCRQGPISERTASAYVLQALDAIAEAHSRGMIHRDLKPANLFLASRGANETIKVLDFGIATNSNEPGLETRLTRTNTVMGSPGYMSPEQLRSARHVDARSDIWALGVILYELVSGTQPFGGESFSAISIAIATESYAPLRGASPPFAAVVNRCLSKDPSHRFQTAAELAAALAPIASTGGDAPRVAAHNATTLLVGAGSRPPSTTLGGATGQRGEPPGSASRRWLLAGGLVAFAAIAALILANLGARSSSRPAPDPGPESSASHIATTRPVPSAVPAAPAPFAVDAPIAVVVTPIETPDAMPTPTEPSIATPAKLVTKAPGRTKPHGSSVTTSAAPPARSTPEPATMPPATDPPADDPWGHMHHDHPGGT